MNKARTSRLKSFFKQVLTPILPNQYRISFGQALRISSIWDGCCFRKVCSSLLNLLQETVRNLQEENQTKILEIEKYDLKLKGIEKEKNSLMNKVWVKM